MGNETDNIHQATTEKATLDKKVSNMKIGVCEMQGWRKTMEDAAIVLPNYEKNSSLFGILDGHGGSIISEFVAVNFKNVLTHTKSYKKGNYEQALSETFLIMDELLKNKKINNFILCAHKTKEIFEVNKDAYINKKDSIVKLRFATGIFYFDLNQIDLSIGGEGTETTIFKYKLEQNEKVEKIEKSNSEMNITSDNSNLNLNEIELSKNSFEFKDEENDKNIKIDDILFEKSGKKNSLLNGLPSFEEVFNISQYQLNFEPKIQDENFRSSKSIHNYSGDLIADDMGTTANIMLIKNGAIYIANVGDSLSVMYKNKKAYNLNKEHQTIIDSERNRIIKSGSIITKCRINGILNLTRAIGDLNFKSNKKLKRHEQSVISLPEITKIEDIEGIDFIIMGCDGIWDCVKRQMVCEFIDKEIRENPEKDLSEILKQIFDRCVSPVSGVVLGTDNMSCIIIQFLNNNTDKFNYENIKVQKVNINSKLNSEQNKEKQMIF